MSLPEQMQKIKGFFNFHEGPLGTIIHALLLIGVGIGGYLIGSKSTAEEGVAVFSPSAQVISSAPIIPATTTKEEVKTGEGEKAFVASAKGTKYHRIDCPGATTIKEINRVYFGTEEEAKKAGFAPAANCPGLH